CEQRRPLVLARVSAVALEELADDSKGELALQIRAARPKHQPALSARYGASSIEHCSLAEPRSALNDREAAMAHQGPDRRQLRLAFEELHHANDIRLQGPGVQSPLRFESPVASDVPRLSVEATAQAGSRPHAAT